MLLVQVLLQVMLAEVSFHKYIYPLSHVSLLKYLHTAVIVPCIEEGTVF
jgi:hypothetical protein